MSTPATTPSDPQVVQVDINSTTDQIRAAVDKLHGTQPEPAAPAPVAAPAPAPAADSPYTMEPQPDGRIHLKLKTGEEFTGTMDEVLQNLAKSKVDTTLWARSIKEKTETPAPAAQPQQALTPEQQQALEAQKWVADQVAKQLGFNDADELKAAVSQMRDTTAAVTTDQITGSFLAQHPDFPNTNMAVEKLFETMESYKFPYSLEGMKAAHALCIYNKTYSPLSPEQQQASLAGKAPAPARPAPSPVLPTQTVSPVTADGKPVDINLPQDKLRELYLAQLQAERATSGR